MGTDIHPAVEIRRKGIWRYHRSTAECPYYYDYDYDYDAATGISRRVYKLDDDGNRIKAKWDNCKYRLPEAFWQRNYELFAMLSDVRNGDYGTGEYIPPIQDYRGVPANISNEARAKLSNEHSQGWVSLTELLQYPYWEITALNSTADVIQEITAYMSHWIPKGGTSDDVRLVFDFDS